MIWPFGKGKPGRPTRVPKILYFKSGTVAFEYQCAYGFTKIQRNVAVVALIVDAQKEFGWDTAVGRGKEDFNLQC
jgi:hypothetical protein